MTDRAPTQPATGEMARLIAQADWSQTPLGPPETWCAELRVAVDLLLSSQAPLVVCWGPELLFLYNDAFVPSAATKHPGGLGRPSRQVWAEIWDEIGPLLRHVMETGETVRRVDHPLVMSRRGFPEQTYWSYSYAPVHGPDGQVLGVFVVPSETTVRLVGERRLRLLGRLAGAGRRAASVAAALRDVAEIMDEAREDVSFAVLWEIDGESEHRAASAGLDGTAPGLDVPKSTEPVVVDLPAPVSTRAGETSTRVAVAAVADSEGHRVAALALGVPPLQPEDDDLLAFVRLVGGHVAGAVAAGRAESERQRRSEAVAALDRAKTEFFAGVSHEFRTPLALILGPLEELRPHVAAVALPELDTLERNARRMLRLVDNLLDVTRLEAGRVDAAFAPVDLAAVTAELAGVFRAAAAGAGLSLEVDAPALPEPVWVDRDQWERVVFNLLSNAVKFTVEGAVTVRLRAEARHAVLGVLDTGCGIPPDELPRVFERFHRVGGARPRSQEGPGIGLALVRQLVELHGGEVSVGNRAGGGAEFTVRVPFGVAHVPPEARSAPASIGDGAAAAGSSLDDARRRSAAERPWAGAGTATAETLDTASGEDSGRVLVADDDADVRDYLTRLLARFWEVHTVADGRSALEASCADPPDLVIADVTMPQLDGIALVRALRSDDRTAGVPVILLSARAGEEAAMEGLAAGADDYLVKPFSSRELVARVRGHLRMGRTRRAAERRFRAMADSTPALIWVDDAGGHRVFVNRGWLDFTGVRDVAAELGRQWRRRIHPEDRERYRSVTAAAMQAGAPFEVEYRLQHRDGRYRWVLDRGAPVGGGDRLTGYVGGSLDIDDRHREQHRLRLYARVGAALDGESSAEGRLRALAEVLVRDGLVDRVRVHEGGSDAELVLRAVATAEPGRRARLWESDAPSALRAEVLADGQPRRIGRPDSGAGVVVPLLARGVALGVITVERRAGSPEHHDEDLNVFAEIGRRAGIAVENARLLELERASAQRLALLHLATAEMSASATPAEVAEVAADHLATLLGAPTVGVWLARDGGGPLELLARHGWGARAPRSWERVLPGSDTPVNRAFHSRRPLWLPDRDAWIGAGGLDVHLPAMDAAGLLAVGLLPLVVGDRCLGVAGAAFPGSRVFGDSDRAAAVAAAELTAQALDRSWLLVAETAGRLRAEQLGSVASALARATDLATVAAVAVTHGRSAVGAEAVVVVTGDGGPLRMLAAEGFDASPDLLGDAEHPLALAVRSGEPVWDAPATARGYPIHTAVPLLVGGMPIGALGFRFGTPPVFTPQRRGFVVTFASQCAQAVQRSRLHQAEHEVAVTLQRSLLPQSLPRLERMAVAARYLPGTVGTEAGGDWFDVLDLDDGRVAFVVGDVVGRGPSAAAVMGQLRSAFAANLVNGRSPAEALEQLDHFAHRIAGAKASTVACALVDQQSLELCYACAGHPPPLLAGPDGVRMLMEGRGTPLGVAGRRPFTESSDRMSPGESILLCSDGLFERRDEVVDDGLDRLAGAVATLAAGRPEDVADALLDRMLASRSAPDDVALVWARMLPATAVLQVPPAPEQLSDLRRRVRDWCATAGVGGAAVTDLQLALGEAVTNAIEHAYLHSPVSAVGVELVADPDGTVFARVIDSGRWRPPPADPGFRGRGLTMIRELADDVVIESGEQGTVVAFGIPPVTAEDSSTSPASRPAPEPGTGAPVSLTVDGSFGLRVAGDLDLAGAAAVRGPLLDRLDQGGALRLVLAPDCWVSSAGIALLAELAEHGERRLTVVAAAHSPARRMIALAGLQALLR